MDRKFLPKILIRLLVLPVKFLFLLKSVIGGFMKYVYKVVNKMHLSMLRFKYYKDLVSKLRSFVSTGFVSKSLSFWKKYKIGYVVLILFIVGFGYQLYQRQKVGAWWDNKWYYRRPVTINYSGAIELNDFQIKIPGTELSESTLYTDGKLQGDCSDIRFTDSSGRKLSYWIEETSDTDDLVDCSANDYDVWVKIPKLEVGDNVIYFYYGNENAQSESSGEDTFDFFDGFGNGLDTSRWSATGAYAVANGELSVTTGSVYSNNKVGNNPQNHTFEMKASWSGADATYSGIMIADANYVASSNGNSNKTALKMTQNVGTGIGDYASDGTTTGFNIVGGANAYSQTLGTKYIVGYDFIGNTNINFFVRDTSYTNLLANSYVGTWVAPYYMWLGYFMGSTSGTTDIDDITADWVRIRKYASTSPGTPTAGSEQTQENYSSSGGKPVAYWPLTSDTCDNSGCMNVLKPVDMGKPPILHIGFDEGRISNNQCPDGSVADICDLSGNGNNGTANGGMTDSDFVSGKVGRNALDFDGSDDYISIKNIDIPTTDFTYEFWIKVPSGNSDGNNVFMASDGNGVNMFNIPIDNDLSVRVILSNHYYDFGVHLADDTWEHVAITRAGSLISLFINGVNKGHVYDSTVLDFWECPLLIGTDVDTGCTGNLGNWFDGQIDEAKVYDYARTPEQIKQDYNNTKAYFGGGSSTPQFESINTTAPGNPHVGSTKQVMRFDGVDDYLEVPNNDALNPVNISVAAWVKSDGETWSDSGMLVSKRYEYILHPDLGVNDIKFFILGETGAWTSAHYDPPSDFRINQWHYYVGTYDNSAIKLYVDGRLVSTTPYVNTLRTDDTGPLYIGRDDGIERYFKGQMAGVKIFNYALSADEVKEQYNAGIDGVGTGAKVRF